MNRAPILTQCFGPGFGVDAVTAAADAAPRALFDGAIGEQQEP